MEFNNNFMGLEGFTWWIGVVENRIDPLKIGRCQIRIHGWHTDDKKLLPTESLPWGQPLMPVTDSSTSITLKDGDYVMGFFLDGTDGQFPIIMGSFPGIPAKLLPRSVGFSDQRTDTQLKESPRNPKKVEYNGETGANITEQDKAPRYPNRLNESSFSRISTKENIDKTFIKTKKTKQPNGTLTADVPTADEKTWSEPETKYDAKYPYNRTIETESGHIFELDDTPGKERVHLAHRSGSFVEYFPDGTVVVKNVKNRYQITLADEKVNIQGKCDVTINGDATLLVKGKMEEVVAKDYKLTVKGDYDIKVEGKMTMDIGSQLDITAGDGVTIHDTLNVDKEINTSKVNADEFNGGVFCGDIC